MEGKRCSVCGEHKLLSEFFADKRRSDGRRADCARCNVARTVERQKTPIGRAQVNARTLDYYARNRVRILARLRGRYAERRANKAER
jgi:hypothetical protein